MKVIDVPSAAGSAWIRQAFALFRRQPAGWISLLSCWTLFTVAIFLIVPIVGPALATMLQPALFAGFVLAARDQERDVPVTISYLFAGFRVNGRALVTIGSLALVAEILVVILIGLLGFPRTIPVLESGMPDVQAYWLLLDGKEWLLILGFGLMLLLKGVLWFTTPLLALYPMRPSHAIRWSFYAFIANFLPLLLFGLLMQVIFFFAALPWLLGLLVAMPVYAISHYTSYRQAFDDTP